jgi:hypothetical protein
MPGDGIDFAAPIAGFAVPRIDAARMPRAMRAPFTNDRSVK